MADDFRTLNYLQNGDYRVTRIFNDGSNTDLHIVSESDSDKSTSIATWTQNTLDYSCEKEFKIDRLHALSKVIFSEHILYTLDLQGIINIINLDSQKVVKPPVMSDKPSPHHQVSNENNEEEELAQLQKNLSLKVAISKQDSSVPFFTQCIDTEDLMLLVHNNQIYVRTSNA